MIKIYQTIVLANEYCKPHEEISYVKLCNNS